MVTKPWQADQSAYSSPSGNIELWILSSDDADFLEGFLLLFLACNQEMEIDVARGMW